jgi:hypothetical protein
MVFLLCFPATLAAGSEGGNATPTRWRRPW